jgi:DNA repair exonuclease SbcCD ATPase subunit
MSADLLPLFVSAIVGGGLATGLAALIGAFNERKKVPVDITMTSLGGAEKALLVMKSFLDEAEERIAALKAEMVEDRLRFRSELAYKDQEIVNLQSNIQMIRSQFNELAAQLDRIQRQAQAVQDDKNRQP